jgi:hypothetical protein
MNVKKSKTEVRSGLPLFYQKPAVLHFGEHRTLGLAGADGYSYTADAAAVPLCVGEFMPAIRHYPIVFTNAAEPMPLVVIGLQQRNLQLDSDGKSWRAGHYVPAYVRRYPFIIVDTPDPDQHLLAVEMTSTRVVDTTSGVGERFFDTQGVASSMAAQAMALCRGYHEDHKKTLAFSQALQANGLLTDQKVEFALATGERLLLDGFKGIDRVALNKLSCETMMAWRDAGWIDLIALHFSSQQNWKLLIDRHVAITLPEPVKRKQLKRTKTNKDDVGLESIA